MEQNEIDIGRIFRMVLMHSKLVVLGIVTFSVVGIINYIYTTKEYCIDSLLHVIPEQRSLGSEIDIILGTQNTTDLEVVKDLYVSRTNIIKLIEEKYLNIYLIKKTPKKILKSGDLLYTRHNMVWIQLKQLLKKAKKSLKLLPKNLKSSYI